MFYITVHERRGEYRAAREKKERAGARARRGLARWAVGLRSGGSEGASLFLRLPFTVALARMRWCLARAVRLSPFLYIAIFSRRGFDQGVGNSTRARTLITHVHTSSVVRCRLLAVTVFDQVKPTSSDRKTHTK